MNKNVFFRILSSKLKDYPQSEIDKSIAYYDEIISDEMEDGMAEEDAIRALGSIDDIATDIMLDMPLPALVRSKINKSKGKTFHKGLWLALVILGAPLWIPLLAAAGCVVLAIYITIWSGILALYAFELSFAILAIAGFAGGLILSFTSSIATGLCLIGIALVSAALALFCFKPLIFISKKLIDLTVIFGRWIKSALIGKGA